MTSTCGSPAPPPRHRGSRGSRKLPFQVAVREDGTFNVAPPADGYVRAVGCFQQMDGRSPAASSARSARCDPHVIPVSDGPAVVEAHRELGQIAEPPAGQPLERLHDGRSIEDLVECLVGLGHRTDRGSPHVSIVAAPQLGIDTYGRSKSEARWSTASFVLRVSMSIAPSLPGWVTTATCRSTRR